MSNDDITKWIHLHDALITIDAKQQNYTGLTITLTAGGHTTKVGPALYKPMVGIGKAIEQWESEVV